MTVNAVANNLGKRVLLVDFPSLQGKARGDGSDTDADLRGLFREAEMSNAVLFFDECESIFKRRSDGTAACEERDYKGLHAFPF